MTQEEQIRLYRLMEKLNWFFHQEMHYLNRDIAENDLPKEVQGQLMKEDETL